MANVFKEDDEALLCFQSSSVVASHNWVSKNSSHLYPSSAVRNSIVKWSDWIDKLLGVLLEYKHLAEDLHNHTDVGLGPTVLTHLYKNLHITYAIAARDLELSFGNEEDDYETLAESTVGATPSLRVLPLLLPRQKGSKRGLLVSLKRQKRLQLFPQQPQRLMKSCDRVVETEKEVSKEDLERTKDVEEEKIPAEMIAEKAEHFVAAPEPEVVSILSQLCLVSSILSIFAFLNDVPAFLGGGGQNYWALAVIPIHSVPGSSTTASIADSELAEFEAMDLEAQPDKLEKLGSTPSKAKSKAVDEPRLARDVLNLYNRHEDLNPSLNASKFCKATHEVNLVDYQKQKAELDMLVTDYKETKSADDNLEKQIEELQKQLVGLRERQNRLGAGLGTKTKTAFLVQNMFSTSRLPWKLQRLLLTKECSSRKKFLPKRLDCRRLLGS
ncbi:unnamed protein product [Prunus armeniaca]